MPPPSAAPFNCEPTYDQQLTALCQPRDYPTFRQAGQCDPWQVTMYGTNYSTIWCAYDAAGALVEARRCEDSTAYCGSFCITSANPSGAIVACSSLPDVCDTSAGAASD